MNKKIISDYDVFFNYFLSLNIQIEKEYRFYKKRRWRFDFAFPKHKIAVEIEGGVWINGRHNRPKGFLKDIEKYNFASFLGWRIFRFTPQNILEPQNLNILKNSLEI